MQQYTPSIIEIAARYGASKIRVFGSFVDGNVGDNSDLQDAVIRNLEIIGEAVKNLSPSFRSEHPDVS